MLNFTVRGAPKAVTIGGLQRGHVITLDPELVDVVRNQQSERIRRSRGRA